jgi:hypothetical protein
VSSVAQNPAVGGIEVESNLKTLSQSSRRVGV